METKLKPHWDYCGDVNMLDYGGKFSRCIGNRCYQFIELINTEEACGRDNEGQPKYVVELRMVDLRIISEQNVLEALESCGQSGSFGESVKAECCDSYGCHALLGSWIGNNGNQLLKQAKQQANELLDSSALEEQLARPVNKIGSTALEFMQGDIESAIQRGCESGNADARIMAKMYGAPQSAIDDTRPVDFLPYLFGYMAAMNDTPTNIGAAEGEDISPEYFRGYARGIAVKAGTCPAPGWITQQQ